MLCLSGSKQGSQETMDWTLQIGEPRWTCFLNWWCSKHCVSTKESPLKYFYSNSFHYISPSLLLWVDMHICMSLRTSVVWCTCMWRPEVDVGYLPQPHSISVLTQSLTEPITCRFASLAGQSAPDTHVSLLLRDCGHWCALAHLVFMWLVEMHTQVLMQGGQEAFYRLSRIFKTHEILTRK